MKRCRQPGCSRATHFEFCAGHQPRHVGRSRAKREAEYLKANPICHDCLAELRTRASDVLHDGRALCWRCYALATVGSTAA